MSFTQEVKQEIISLQTLETEKYSNCQQLYIIPSLLMIV